MKQLLSGLGTIAIALILAYSFSANSHKSNSLEVIGALVKGFSHVNTPDSDHGWRVKPGSV